MMRKERALEIFRNHGNCSQAIFAPYRQPDALTEENAMKLATVFGAGCAGAGSGMCGAVSGGLMAISLRYGMGDLHAVAAKAETYALGRQFMESFAESVGSCFCEHILGMNIAHPENLVKARLLNLFETRCEQAIETAAEILEGMLPAEHTTGSTSP